MHNHSKLISLFAILLIGCSLKDESMKLIEFSPEEIDLIEDRLILFDSLYKHLNSIGFLMRDLGYIIDDSNKITFRHCFDINKRRYLSNDECDYRNMPSRFSPSEVISTINALSKLGVHGLIYEPSIYRHVFYVKPSYYRYKDTRYYCIRGDLTDSTINVSYLRLYDEKNGLIMLGP